MTPIQLVTGNLCSLMAMFGTFNGFIYNLVGVITNAVVLITGIVALTRKEKQEESHE